jgi:hypothetical protein
MIHDMAPYLFPSIHQAEPQDAQIAKLKEKMFIGSTLFLQVMKSYQVFSKFLVTSLKLDLVRL